MASLALLSRYSFSHCCLSPTDWLRGLPTSIGAQAFVRLLQTPGALPQTDAEAIALPPFAPDHAGPESDERLAILHELDRAVPRDMRGPSWGVTFPLGRAHALVALRALPDRAGNEAVYEALHGHPWRGAPAEEPEADDETSCDRGTGAPRRGSARTCW